MTSGEFKAPEAPLRIQNGKVYCRIGFNPNGKIFVRNRHNEFTLMKNRFDLVEDTTIDTTRIPNYAGWSSESGTLIQFFEEDLQEATAAGIVPASVPVRRT